MSHETAVLRRSDVKRILGITSNQALGRYVETKRFPAPHRWLSPRTPVWRKQDIEGWLGHEIKETSDAVGA